MRWPQSPGEGWEGGRAFAGRASLDRLEGPVAYGVAEGGHDLPGAPNFERIIR